MIRKPTFGEALVPVISMVVLLGVGYGYLGLQSHVLLLLAAAVTAIIGVRVGLTWDLMLEGISEKIHTSLPAILIMISVGLLIGTWMVSGTIPMMIYYGLQIISPQFLLVTAFLVTAIVSTFTGTSFGSAGTIGVAIMGIAIGLGVSLPATAGAVIAGAYFGDKLSPFSDTTILAPIAAGSNLYDHIKHMLYTTIPASIVSIIVYTAVGLSTSVSDASSPEKVNEMLTTLSTMFHWNILLLIPPILIFYGAMTKKPIIPTMALSSVIASILAMIFQGSTLKNVFTAMYSGFNISMVHAPGFDSGNVMKEIITLVNRGGMSNMMGTILLIICAFVFAGIVSKAGCLEVILDRLSKKISTVPSLITSTVFSCILMSFVTGSSYLAILIPGELFKDAYRLQGLHPKNLSRTLEDSGTVVVPLVPWSIAGVYMAGTLGVPTLQYAPWAVLCYTGFIFAIILAFTGIGIAKLDPEDQSTKA